MWKLDESEEYRTIEEEYHQARWDLQKLHFQLNHNYNYVIFRDSKSNRYSYIYDVKSIKKYGSKMKFVVV